MGEMADLAYQHMERGRSWVRNNKTQEIFEIPNVDLIWGPYREPEYTVLGDANDEPYEEIE